MQAFLRTCPPTSSPSSFLPQSQAQPTQIRLIKGIRTPPSQSSSRASFRENFHSALHKITRSTIAVTRYAQLLGRCRATAKSGVCGLTKRLFLLIRERRAKKNTITSLHLTRTHVDKRELPAQTPTSSTKRLYLVNTASSRF